MGLGRDNRKKLNIMVGVERDIREMGGRVYYGKPIKFSLISSINFSQKISPETTIYYVFPNITMYLTTHLLARMVGHYKFHKISHELPYLHN